MENNFFNKKVITIILASLAGLLVILAVFSAGIYVGFHKARFNYQWGENYHKNFGGPMMQGRNFEARDGRPQPLGFFREMRGNDFFNGSAAVGSVVKFTSNTLYIVGDDKVEKGIAIDERTVIRKGNELLKLSDLKTDDKVTVLGAPSSTGEIEARLIRVFAN
jgi:hypothetical protein